MKTPILGSAYVARSVNAADARMVNLFPEIVPEGGKEPAFLNRCPGLKFQNRVGTGPIRGLWVCQSNPSEFYIASGNEFYKLDSLTGTPVKLGDISGIGPVSIADNGVQLFIACGAKGYIYDQSVFSEITDPDFSGATTVTYLDGYFVYNQPNSQTIWVSQLLNGASVDPLDFASAEGSPDGVVGVLADHRELWVFGTTTTEVWYNAGLADFPLAPIQGAFNEFGCASAFSIAKLDNTIFWLGTDPRGVGIVYRAEGYVAKRVSTHAIEWQIQQYPTIKDAIGFSYQQEGHTFYVLCFPTAGKTWVYDASTLAWHERAGWKDGEFTRHRANCYCDFQNNAVVGDFENGNIYTYDLNVYTDNGQPQKWLRSWRALLTGENNLKRTAQHSLQLDIETGVGLDGILNNQTVYLLTEQQDNIITEDNNYLIDDSQSSLVQGSDPEVMLRWSDDGGHTWSNEHWNKIGKIGQYGKRVIWRRLGMTDKLRDRVYEISMTDPVKTAIMGAELTVSPTGA